MRGTWTRVCLALLATVWTGTLLAATHPADDAISVVNWVAPPYWTTPAAESPSGSKHLLAPSNPALAFHAVIESLLVRGPGPRYLPDPLAGATGVTVHRCRAVAQWAR